MCKGVKNLLKDKNYSLDKLSKKKDELFIKNIVKLKINWIKKQSLMKNQ